MAFYEDEDTNSGLDSELGIVLLPPPEVEVEPEAPLYLMTDETTEVAEEYENKEQLLEALKKNPLIPGETLYIRLDEHARLLLEAKAEFKELSVKGGADCRHTGLGRRDPFDQNNGEQQAAVAALFNATPEDLASAYASGQLSQEHSVALHAEQALIDLTEEINSEVAASLCFAFNPEND